MADDTWQVDEHACHLISLDLDGVTRVWDVRAMRCLQKLNGSHAEEGLGQQMMGGIPVTRASRIDASNTGMESRHRVSALAFDQPTGRISLAL